MIDELKPVPCGCGGEASVITCAFGNAKMVLCGRCGMRTVQATETKAIEAWNKAMSGSAEKSSTVERTAKVERTSVKNTYICSNCGKPMHPVDFSMPNKYCGFCGAKLDWSGNDEKA